VKRVTYYPGFIQAWDLQCQSANSGKVVNDSAMMLDIAYHKTASCNNLNVNDVKSFRTKCQSLCELGASGYLLQVTSAQPMNFDPGVLMMGDKVYNTCCNCFVLIFKE